MKCLVLGANGFIGSHLCEGLLTRGYQVRAFVKKSIERVAVAHSASLLPIEYVYGDFSNKKDIEKSVNGIDIIYHLISTTLPQTSNQNMEYDISSNVLSTLTLLEAANKNGVKKVIFFSSGGTVYGKTKEVLINENHPAEPICSYGIQKLMIEKYLHLFNHLYGLDFNILRIANPYGIGQSYTRQQGVIPVFMHRIIEGHPIEVWGDGSIVRDYIHVTDVVQAAIKASEYYGESKLFNIGSGKGYSISEIIRRIEGITGKKIIAQYKPSRQVDVPTNVLDIALAEKVLSWNPKISLSNGLTELYQHLIYIKQNSFISKSRNKERS